MYTLNDALYLSELNFVDSVDAVKPGLDSTVWKICPLNSFTVQSMESHKVANLIRF